MTTTRIFQKAKLFVAGGVAAAALLIGLAAFSSSAQAQGSIYWSVFTSTPGGGAPTRVIGTANIDGSGKRTDLVNFGQTSGFLGVATNGSHLYWAQGTPPGTNPSKTRVYRAAPDGTNPSEILASADGALFTGIALDSSHLFFPNVVSFPSPTASILRANLDGSGANPDFIDQTALGTFTPQAVAVDSQYIYWGIPMGPASKIARANLDGSLPNTNFITGRNFPTSIAVAGNKIFWTEFEDGSPPPPQTSVFMADLDGSNPTSFATGTTGVSRVAADENFVYWGTNEGKIGRARHDGTSIEADFITGITDLTSVLGGLAVSAGGPGPGPDPDPVAALGKVTVSGPAKVKRGKTAIWKVRIPNTGTAAATGVRVAVSGRGIKINTPAAQIAPGKARTEVIKARLRKPGKFTATFKVNTANAGSKTVKRSITVRK